tara:strand:- start:2291 stop:3025 length:735 start_codon:yes stop_codon:yes gene_type:complete
MGAMIRFLQAVRRLAKLGVKKDEIIEFGKREFGEITDLLRKQIDDIYDRFKSPASGTKQPGEVVDIKTKEKITDEFNLTEDDPMGDLEKIVKGEGETGLPKKKDEGIGSLVEPEDRAETFLKTDEERVALGFPNRRQEGIVRTGAREILSSKGISVDAGDPIDKFRTIFGDDALEMLDNISEDMIMSKNYDELTQVLQRNKMFDIEPKAGLNVDEAEEVKEIVDFDPTDRKPNQSGGLAGILGV